MLVAEETRSQVPAGYPAFIPGPAVYGQDGFPVPGAGQDGSLLATVVIGSFGQSPLSAVSATPFVGCGGYRLSGNIARARG